MDLLTGRPLWIPTPLRAERLPARATAAVVIVGAGVSGALLAEKLASQGVEVVAVDKRLPGHGSTLASTAIVDYALDIPLSELQQTIGADGATLVYRSCLTAVEELVALIGTLPGDTLLRPSPSLVLAYSPQEASELVTEARVREQAGFDVRLLGEREISATYPWKAERALLHPRAATVDPVRLTEALWRKAIAQGATLYSGSAMTDFTEHPIGVEVEFDGGQRITCEYCILASGYEAKPYLPPWVGRLTSSYAAATSPGQSIPGWDDNEVIWEVRKPYLYLRRTNDDRIVIGGRDKPFRNPTLRDLLLPWEKFQLRRELRRLLGEETLMLERVWCGTFAESDDGLPYLGPLPTKKRIYGIFGSGGNGIVISVLARSLVADWLEGRSSALAKLVAIDRPRQDSA